MNLLPPQIVSVLSRWFDYQHTEVYCQLANQANSKPYVRTMRLYAITALGELEFLSRTDTQKWRDWQINPHAAVCLFNPNFGQIVVEGHVKLTTLLNKMMY